MNLHTLESKLCLVAANAVYCGASSMQVQLCEFTPVSVDTAVSVMTHCSIIFGTITTTLVSERPSKHLIHGSCIAGFIQLIKTVLHTDQNSSYKCCCYNQHSCYSTISTIIQICSIYLYYFVSSNHAKLHLRRWTKKKKIRQIASTQNLCMSWTQVHETLKWILQIFRELQLLNVFYEF